MSPTSYKIENMEVLSDLSKGMREFKLWLKTKQQPCPKTRTKVASTHGDHTVRVTDMLTGKCTHVLTGHPRTPWCVAFHPSSNEILASGCLGGEVRIWDLHGGGSEVWHSQTNGVIASLAFHPMDHVLVFATGNTLYFWDWSQPEPFAFSRTNYEYERIRWLRFDPLGHYLYTGIANNTTVHREPSNVVHINETNSPHPNRLRQYANRRRYQQVMQRFHDYQQGRYRWHPGRLDEDVNMNLDSNDLEGETGSSSSSSSTTVPDIQQRLRRVGELASSFTETSRRAQEIVSAISERRRRRNINGDMTSLQRLNVLPNIQRGTWSPPPHVWPSLEDEDEEDDQEEMSSGLTGTVTPPQLSEIAQVAAQRPVSVRPGLAAPSASTTPSSRSTDSWFSRSSLTNTTTSRAGSRPFAFGVNSRSGLRFEHIPQSQRPSSSSNSIMSSSLSSSLQRLRSRPSGSAFREVSRSNRHDSEATPTTSSSSHLPCAICRTFNTTLTNRNQSFSTANSSPSHQLRWSSPYVVPTSSGLVIPRSRPSVSSSRRLLNMMVYNRSHNSPLQTGLPTRSSHSRSQGRTPTMDGTSQTSGTMELPECSDQGTDVVGLDEERTLPLELDNIEDSSSEQEQLGDGESVFDNDSLLEPERLMDSENINNLDTVMETNERNESVSNVRNRNDQTNDQSSISEADMSGISEETPRPEDLTSLTMRLERQVTELDRRITALRERFTERLRALHQDRERIINLRGRISNQSSPESVEATPTVTSGQASQHVPLITITRPRDQGDFSHTPGAYNTSSTSGSESSQNTQLLEMFLRGGENNVSNPTHLPLPPPSLSSIRVTPSREEEEYHEERSWHSLQQRYLHPHYSVSILDDTINRPNDALHAAINRAIAGAFMGTGEPAVASNIIPQTHRIQRWDFTKCQIPDISKSKVNIVVPHCKLHNDASCDISQDATFLATFVPSHRGFPDDNILAVFSIHPDSFAQCLFTKRFGPNAISVSISPRNQFAMVGLAAKRLSWVFTTNQLVAQVYQLSKKNAGENSMKHVTDVFHTCDMDVRTHVSVNSARWLRGVGQGMVYGTNRGDLHICRYGVKNIVMKASEEFPDSVEYSNRGVSPQEGTSIRMNLMSMLGGPSSQSRTSSIATQTLTRGIRRTAGTQTDQGTELEEDSD